MEERFSKILSSFQRQCSRREYCSGDILRKILKAADGNDEDAGKILSSLISDGYVDDKRYAAAFAREKSSLSGWGPVKIRFALASKGIPRETIEEALSGIDDSRASEKLERTLAAKWKTLTGGCSEPPVDARLKLIRFALSRGYEYDAVRKAMEKMAL